MILSHVALFRCGIIDKVLIALFLGSFLLSHGKLACNVIKSGAALGVAITLLLLQLVEVDSLLNVRLLFGLAGIELE